MTLNRKGRIRLGAFAIPSGHHIAGWRHPDSAWDIAHVFDLHVRIAQAAEQAKFDMLFLADTLGGIDPDSPADAYAPPQMTYDPLTLLPAIAARTQHIGLVGTATTTYNEPYHIARKFGTLDLISGGRSGWNAVTSADPREAGNFQQDPQADRGLRYVRAEEFVDVVQGLWRSFDADAFSVDRDTGTVLDLAKVHALNHVGDFFTVRGPLSCERSPQGQPVLVQAGSSEAGMQLAARTAEVVFTAQASLELGKAFYADLKSRMAPFSRPPENLLVMPGLMPIVGATRAEAEAKLETLQALLHPKVALKLLERMVGGADLSTIDLDAPPPDWLADVAFSRASVLLDIGRTGGLTMMQLAQRAALGRGHNLVVGTADDVCDVMEQWFNEYAADGFNILAPYFMDGFTDFTDAVIPELQRRGLFRTEYEADTLRGNLGLPVQ